MSLDGVDLREGDAGIPRDGDHSLTDGIDAPGDGDDQPRDGDAGATDGCFDRGDFTLDGITVRGLDRACEGGSVCIEGTCTEEPTCAPGITSACKLSAQSLGARQGLVAIEDDFYWFDRGTVDALGNYGHDGSLMRMAAGQWQPEKVGDAIDFFDYENNVVTEPGIGFGDGFLTTRIAHKNLLVSPDGSKRYEFEGGAVSCVTAGVAILESYNNETGKATVTAHELASGTQTMLARFETNGYSYERSCRVHENQVAYQRMRGGDVQVFDLTAGTNRWFGPFGILLGFDGESFTHLQGAVIGRAPVPDTYQVSWTNLRRVTPNGVFGEIKVTDDHVTWTRIPSALPYASVLRGSLLDDADARVIVEMTPPDNQAVSSWRPFSVDLGRHWVGYETVEVNTPTADTRQSTLHFVPVPSAD